MSNSLPEIPQRNLSFTDGETQGLFEELQPQHKAAALAIRHGLLEKFEDTPMSEASLALFGLEHVATGRTTENLYIAHVTEPLERPTAFTAGMMWVPGVGPRRIHELHGRYDLLWRISRHEQVRQLSSPMSEFSIAGPAIKPEPSFDAWYPVVRVGQRVYRHYGRGTGLAAPNKALSGGDRSDVRRMMSERAKAQANKKRSL